MGLITKNWSECNIYKKCFVEKFSFYQASQSPPQRRPSASSNCSTLRPAASRCVALRCASFDTAPPQHTEAAAPINTAPVCKGVSAGCASALPGPWPHGIARAQGRSWWLEHNKLGNLTCRRSTARVDSTDHDCIIIARSIVYML